MPNKEIYFPKKSVGGYFDASMNRWFKSKGEKREYMNKNKLIEDGTSDRTLKARKRHLHEQIEEGRKKQGLRPRSWKEKYG